MHAKVYLPLASKCQCKDRVTDSAGFSSRFNHYLCCFFFFYLLEYFLIENQQSATDERYGACLYVESKTEGADIKLTGCNETDDRQSWFYTQKGQVKASAGGPVSSRILQHVSLVRQPIAFMLFLSTVPFILDF